MPGLPDAGWNELANAFMEMIARDAGLAGRAAAMSADEPKAPARTIGVKLTGGDLEQAAGTGDELSAVAGGGGTAGDIVNACGCVAIGTGLD